MNKLIKKAKKLGFTSKVELYVQSGICTDDSGYEMARILALTECFLWAAQENGDIDIQEYKAELEKALTNTLNLLHK